MQESSQASYATAVAVVCPFCGATELLPADRAERVLVLRRRVVELTQARQMLVANASFTRMFESKAWGPSLGFTALVVVAMTLQGTWSTLGPILGNPAISRELRAELLTTSTIGPCFTLGTLGGLALSYLVLGAYYRTRIRPELLARAPAAPGTPPRCRSCGGDLVPGPDAFTMCRFCGATSLVSAELSTRRAELLERETREYQARAAGVRQVMHAASSASSWVFVVGYLGGAVLGVGGAAVLRHALVSLLID
jgi:hypothetical protein